VDWGAEAASRNSVAAVYDRRFRLASAVADPRYRCVRKLPGPAGGHPALPGLDGVFDHNSVIVN